MRVLYVEDDPYDVQFTLRELKRTAPEIALDVARTVGEAFGKLSDSTASYDLILTDFRLPDGDGLELLARVRAEGLTCAVVLITGQGDEETAIAALKGGADDYVVKHRDYLRQLPQTLKSALQRYQAQRARMERRLHVLYAEHHVQDVDLTRRHFERYAPYLALDIVHTAPEIIHRLSIPDSSLIYDVLLLDYRLPGMNGLEAIKELHQRGIDIPIVVVTGHGDEDIAVQAIRLGAADYVVKNPGYLFQLPSVVENVFHRATLVREQAALRESETRYRSLFRNNHAVMLLIDPCDGKIVDANPAAATFYGWSEDQLRQMQISEINTLAPDDLQREMARAHAEQRNRFIFRHRRADGTTRDVEVFSGPIVVQARELLYSIVHDITERIQAETALRESEANLRESQRVAHVGHWWWDPRTNQINWSEEMKRIWGLDTEGFSGKLEDIIAHAIHPDDRAAVETANRAVIEGLEPLPLIYRILRPDQSIRSVLAIPGARTFDDSGAIIRLTGIVQDITERVAAEQQIRAALASERQARYAAEQATERVSLLQQVTAAFAGAHTIDEVVQIVIEHGQRIAGAAALFIALLDEHNNHFEIIRGHGLRPEVFTRFQGLSRDSALPPALVVRTREPLWIESRAAAEAMFPEVADLFNTNGDLAFVLLPLATGDYAGGVLGLRFSMPQTFSAEDRSFMLALAQQCAQALERVRLNAAIQATNERLQALSQRLFEAQEQERRHIARELHDQIGQMLSAMKINLHMLRSQTTQETGLRRLDESLNMIDQLIGQVRTLSLDLRPAVLDDLGLAAALAWYCERLGQRSGLELTFSHDLQGRQVEPMIATACFRVAQEALTNIMRHAGAHRVMVELYLRDRQLSLVVRDDGVGFDVAAQRARASSGASLGLLSIVERAELVGGWVDIASSPGEGSEIWAWFPLSKSKEE